jgi:serine/threonine protein kinase
VSWLVHTAQQQNSNPQPTTPSPPPAEQMLLGLRAMHARKVLHRDFKTLNVFLDEGRNVKLGDLGVAKVGDALFGLLRAER